MLTPTGRDLLYNSSASHPFFWRKKIQKLFIKRYEIEKKIEEIRTHSLGYNFEKDLFVSDNILPCNVKEIIKRQRTILIKEFVDEFVKDRIFTSLTGTKVNEFLLEKADRISIEEEDFLTSASIYKLFTKIFEGNFLDKDEKEIKHLPRKIERISQICIRPLLKIKWSELQSIEEVNRENLYLDSEWKNLLQQLLKNPSSFKIIIKNRDHWIHLLSSLKQTQNNDTFRSLLYHLGHFFADIAPFYNLQKKLEYRFARTFLNKQRKLGRPELNPPQKPDKIKLELCNAFLFAGDLPVLKSFPKFSALVLKILPCLVELKINDMAKKLNLEILATEDSDLWEELQYFFDGDKASIRGFLENILEGDEIDLDPIFKDLNELSKNNNDYNELKKFSKYIGKLITNIGTVYNLNTQNKSISITLCNAFLHAAGEKPLYKIPSLL